MEYIFSIFISDTVNNLKKHIKIGGYDIKYIHEPEKNLI